MEVFDTFLEGDVGLDFLFALIAVEVGGEGDGGELVVLAVGEGRGGEEDGSQERHEDEK